MKHLLILLTTLVAFPTLAQEGDAINGQLTNWGALYQDEQIVGHYSITLQADESLEAGINTLTLFDTDLHAIGSKSYAASADLTVQDLAYNGKHLGVLIQQSGRASVELLDGDATTVATLPLQNRAREASGIVYATGGGFLTLQGFQLSTNQPASAVNYYLEYLASGDGGESWSRRFGDPERRRESTIVQVAGLDDDFILLRTWQYRQSGTKTFSTCTLHVVDLATGKDRFTVPLPEERAEHAYAIAAAAHVGDEIHVLTSRADYADRKHYFRGSQELISYDLAGKLIGRHPIDLHRMAEAELRERGLDGLHGKSEFNIQSAEFTAAGDVTLVAEVYHREKKEVIYSREFIFALDPEGNGLDVLPLRRKPLTLPAYFLGRGFGPGLFGPDLQDHRMAEVLSLHDGPFNHALSVRQGEDVYHYVWDREFTTVNARYNGVHAVVCRGGKLLQEFVPLADTELAWIFPARRGYFMLLEPRLAANQLVPRLEKLTH